MTTAQIQDTPLRQFAVVDALMAGSYESGIPVRELRASGDFGLGCCDGLGGEVVIVDGEAFECTLDGPPSRMGDDELLPFAQVCALPAASATPLQADDEPALARAVEDRLVSRNLFHAIRLDGALDSVRVRVTARQRHPHRPLADVVREQVETDLRDVRGTLVGFWTPALYQGIGVAGLHLHFLSEDRSQGGHVLDLAGVAGAVRLAAFSRFDLRLPVDPEFLGTELTHDEDRRIAAVENRHRSVD